MIGILGGTFDPIHFGHLRPVLDVVEKLNIEKCHFIPCSIPHHRALPTASSAQRLDMVTAAIKNEPRFYLDPREIERDGTSYTIDTLESIDKEITNNETICLIVGIDAFVTFDQWHRWQDILKICHVVVTHRPRWNVEKIFERNKISTALDDVIANHRVKNKSELDSCRYGKIIFQSVTQLDISSTNIRVLLADNKSVDYLLPDDVINIIKNQNIYVK